MGTHYQGKRKVERALDTYIKLQRSADTIAAQSSRHLKLSGLTESQFGVLEMLLHLGPLQQSVIGEKLLKTGGNVTVVINHLEQRKLIRRQINPQDRRCVQVHLTDQGRELIETVFPLHAGRIAALMGTLDAEELSALGALCRKLGHGAAQA